MSERSRPDPEKLLEQIQREERQSSRGKLKIFFGYVAGVGKTYAMLEAAQQQKAAGADIVVGYAETHGRAETDALLEGLESIPALEVDYRDIKLREFDLDAVLARRPEIVLVDELAHTNAPGLRHAKRWQDVEELLDAGINVYSTLNVQHLESLNDVVREVTGVQVRETIPDSIFDEADSVEVIDLPPGELLERLSQGKIYVPTQAARALENFFQGANLGALREVTLRRTADRTHAHLEDARVAAADREQTWRISEMLLVCVGPSPTSAKVIRDSKRMAARANAHWIAAGVETTRRPLSDAQRTRLLDNIKLAESLGAETVTLVGDNIADEIVSYARSRSVTRIVIGKSGQPRWRSIVTPNTVDQLLRLSGDIDIYVIQGYATGESPPAPKRPRTPYVRYLYALALVIVAAAIAGLLQAANMSEANRSMVFLPAVVLAAMWWGMGPGIFAAAASVLAFDFFFVPPRYTFVVQDAQYLLTLVVMLAVASLVGTLAARLRKQIQTSRARENRLEAMYSLSRTLSGTSGIHQLALASQQAVSAIFRVSSNIYLPDGNILEPVLSSEKSQGLAHELAVATWCYEHRQMAGKGTDTLPNSRAVYVPLMTSQQIVGVLGVEFEGVQQAIASPDVRQLLESISTQIAIAIERDELAEQRRSAVLDARTERMRSSLLSSVSHDLRTPLAVIAGASSTLLEMGESNDSATRDGLMAEIYEESNRLSRLVENLLTMTRFESAVAVDKQWFPLEDVVGSALGRLRDAVGARMIGKDIQVDLPLVPLDGVMIEQVLFNLLENALKYSPVDSPIDVSAKVDGDMVVVQVADRGPGLTPEESDLVFEKLYRGSAAKGADRGAGLGLAIAKAIIEVHGGKIWATARPGGGSVFFFSLPIESEMPPPEEPIEDENLEGLE